ncbi:MAG: CvpA family protein [Bacillota bacterium]|nr:CvpA family protein [Bacillota bacterium]
MNLLDILVILIIAVCILYGCFRGFLTSLLKLCSFFFSWFTALVFYPLVSKLLVLSSSFYDTIVFYTDGAEKIANLQHASLVVSALSDAQIKEIVHAANLPAHISETVQTNLSYRVFENQGMKTVGDYFNVTVADVVINIISFFIIFIIIWFALSIIFNILGGAKRAPSLRKYDSLLGGSLGFVQGIFMTFLIFALIPALLIIVSMSSLTRYIDNSALGSFFYKSNFIMGLIKGVI